MIRVLGALTLMSLALASAARAGDGDGCWPADDGSDVQCCPGMPEPRPDACASGAPAAPGASAAEASTGGGAAGDEPSFGAAFRPLGTTGLARGGSAGGAAPGAKRGPAAAASAGEGGGAASPLPEALSGLQFAAYPSLAAMPEHAGPHGVARLSPGKGIAVGFVTGPSTTYGNSRGGHCDIGETGVVASNIGKYTWNAWISERPGGPPLANCAALGIGAGSGAGVSYLSADADALKLLASPEGQRAWGPVCALKPFGAYFCNVAGASGLIASPLGVADYTAAQSMQMSVGVACNPPGSTKIGHFDAEGNCR